MSSTITVYAISFDQLKRVPGSKDRQLAEAIGTELEWYLSQIDELWDGDEDDDILTCRDAVVEIIEGAPLAPHLGYLYGYAFEAICAYLGRELPNIPAISRTSSWINKMDEFLKSHEMPISLSDLVYTDGPIDIPTPDDYPFIGSWPPQIIPGALEASRRVDLVGLDYEMAETITLIRGWLEAAAEEPGNGLIGFLS